MRLGVPHVLLDKQGRARPEIAALYSWRYASSAAEAEGLGNLPAVEANGTGELPPLTTTTTAATSTSEAMVVDGSAATATVSASIGMSVSVGGCDVRYQRANAGFVHTFQFVDVGDFQGRGETQPTPYFYQVTIGRLLLKMMIVTFIVPNICRPSLLFDNDLPLFPPLSLVPCLSLIRIWARPSTW